MIRLVALHGIGDCYLTCALLKAFREHHGDAVIVLKSAHVAVADLFGVPYEVDDQLVGKAESDVGFQQAHQNEIQGRDPNGEWLFIHPSFIRSGVRIDYLTAKSFVSHADMWRALMHLPMDAPLERPFIPGLPSDGKVLLIPEARSWPNNQPAFWAKLRDRLKLVDYQITVNNPCLSLAELFRHAAQAEWVIGPQCGFMAAITHAQFPCRKTFCTPEWNTPFGAPTFPYAYVTKFTGEDYDVEEFQIQDQNYDVLVNLILTGKNACRLPYSPEPVKSINMPLSPGDFYDRFSVLMVKASKFTGAKRAAIQRELDRYFVAAYISRDCNLIGHALVDELIAVNHSTYLLCESYVPDSLSGKQNEELHIRAIEHNKRRVELKQQIDALFHAPYSDVKDYYK